MCSGCSGDYEGDGDGCELASGSCHDKFDDRPLERSESMRTVDFQREMRSHEGNEVGNEGMASEAQMESEYDVFVSADRIIEIHRIAGYFAGLS
jgi:hypothetical protein